MKLGAALALDAEVGVDAAPALDASKFLLRVLKGTVSRDFLLQVFFMNLLPTSP